MAERPKIRKNGRDANQDRRSTTIENALRAMIRDYYQDHFGTLPRDGDWSLNLEFKVNPNEDWKLVFDTPLTSQLQQQVEQMEADCDVFQQGRVFCFRCETSDCEHSMPGSALEVFAGYDQVGCPLWNEFAQLLLDLSDERVGALFGDQSKVITRFVRGRDLRTRQLTYFGRSSKTYALLCQISAGYFDVSLGRGERTKIAMTFQAVEVRGPEGKPALELNTLCSLPPEFEYEEVFAQRFPWVQRARNQTKAALKQVEKELNSPKGRNRECMKRVPDILRKLAGELERGFRQKDRQTRHARDRKLIARPIDMAMADLRHARRERMYQDLKDKTIVLCADKGRCHIFNHDGRHVTSFVIQSDAIRARVRKNRWASLEPVLFNKFLSHFGSPTEARLS